MAGGLRDSGILTAPVAAPMADSRDRRRGAQVTSEELFVLVYRQMRALAGNRDVDELAQAAVEQAIRALPSFAGESRLSTWTFRICYLTVRKHDRWYRRWLRRFTLTEDGELRDCVADGPSVYDEFVRSQRAGRLRVALERLSPKQRVTLVLHDLEGLSVDEIAGVVGARPRAVRSRLRDARNRIAVLLAGDPYFGVDACQKEEAK